MSAFDKSWAVLKNIMSFDVPSDRIDEYDKEYAMFGGAQGLRNQHQAYLQAYHGGYPRYAGIELPGDFLHDEEFMADEEPPMSFDEFAQMEIRNMKDFKNMPYFRKYPERFKDDYGDMIDDESNY